jgi:hypothetical protein
MSWIDITPVELYQQGDMTQERDAITAVTQVAEMLYYRRFCGDCPESEAADMVAEAVAKTLEQLRKPKVDFTQYSCFNWVYTRCLGAMTKYKRECPKEIRLSDLPEEAERSIDNWEGVSPDASDDSMLLLAMESEYNRLRTRLAVFGYYIENFDTAMDTGCEFHEGEEEWSQKVLRIVSLRLLFP